MASSQLERSFFNHGTNDGPSRCAGLKALDAHVAQREWENGSPCAQGSSQVATPDKEPWQN